MKANECANSVIEQIFHISWHCTISLSVDHLATCNPLNIFEGKRTLHYYFEKNLFLSNIQTFKKCLVKDAHWKLSKFKHGHCLLGYVIINRPQSHYLFFSGQNLKREIAYDGVV